MMTHKPIPGGYVDNQHLARAMAANHKMRRIVGLILSERPGVERMAILLAQMAYELGEQANALQEMDKIRKSRKEES
ncbi:MAG: hypothetical protein GXP39_08050 [Chloroflexi bacterium]|nr:hypothetical protein [Chloroflexota bacterium]